LQFGDKFVNIGFECGTPETFHGLRRRVRTSRIFPKTCKATCSTPSRSPPKGGKSDKAKPFKGVDGGVFEIALKHRGDAFRAIYALKIDADIWVVHAFQKKSKSGIKTPQMEVDLIRERVKRLKEALK
jgi:phage-related protein